VGGIPREFGFEPKDSCGACKRLWEWILRLCGAHFRGRDSVVLTGGLAKAAPRPGAIHAGPAYQAIHGYREAYCRTSCTPRRFSHGTIAEIQSSTIQFAVRGDPGFLLDPTAEVPLRICAPSQFWRRSGLPLKFVATHTVLSIRGVARAGKDLPRHDSPAAIRQSPSGGKSLLPRFLCFRSMS